METEILKFDYRDKLIEFETKNGSVMVNATQMAKLFDKNLTKFTQSDHAKSFVLSCIKLPYGSLFDVKSEADLIVSKQKSGTWMHRVLALKFAAWLNSDFEVWVYSTIEDILFAHYKTLEKSLKQSAQRKKEITGLKEKLNESPEFQRLQLLELEEKQAAYTRGKQNRSQLDMFINQ